MSSRTSSSQAARDQPHSEPRRYIYAALDLLFATAYALLFALVIPTRHTGGRLLVWSLVGVVAVMGVAMLIRSRWAWRIAASACGLMLALEVVLLVAILASAAFLAGVYGAFGRGGALLAVVAALFTIEAVALLPALQLKFLMTRAGRRCFGLEPLRRR